MLRRCLRRNVNFLLALVPSNTVRLPTPLLTDDQVASAVKAVDEAAAVHQIDYSTLKSAISLLNDPRQSRTAQQLFQKSAEKLRNELLANQAGGSGAQQDGSRRLHMHEAVMAAGYYARACDQFGPALEPIRFVINHYNFDVRRDLTITKQVHQTLLEHLPTTKASDDMLTEILVMERKLFGELRLQPVGGQQWLCLGAPLVDITKEEELMRIMDLAPIQTHGNFEVVWKDVDKRWKVATLKCLPEVSTEPAFAAALKSQTEVASALSYNTTGKSLSQNTNREWSLRALKPAPPLSWGEWIKEKLLNAFVYWFSFWIIFFMIDEEVITLIGLLWGKYQHGKVMAEEAERTGQKVYMARTKFW